MIRGGARPGAVLVVAFALAGCATVAPPLHKLPDGSYQIACAEALATCLQAFETVCDWHGYDVISASERRHHPDLREAGNETIASEAQVRCKPGEALFGGSPAAPAPAPAAPAPAPVATPAQPPPPTAESPSIASPTSCSVPPVDGGAAACTAPRPAAGDPR